MPSRGRHLLLAQVRPKLGEISHGRSFDQADVDQTVLLTGFYSRQGFDRPLRRINVATIHKPASGWCSSPTISPSTRSPSPSSTNTAGRWNCSSNGFKQHLRIKAFFGTSENAVKSQIWIAVSVYVLVAIVKKRLALPATLYEILQILKSSPCPRKPRSIACLTTMHRRKFLPQTPTRISSINVGTLMTMRLG